MIEHLTAWGWLAAGACALSIGLAKAGLPGLGILPVPLLALIIPPKESSGVMVPMLVFGDVLAASYYRRRVIWSHVLPLLPCTLVGIVAGAITLRQLGDRQVGPMIGVIILALLALSRARRRVGDHDARGAFRHARTWAVLFGALAGFTSMVANAAGPVVVLYLLAMKLPKEEFIGTGAWFFLFMNWTKVPFSAGLGLITLDSLKFDAILAPLIVVGTVLAIFIQKRIPQRYFDWIVEALTAAAAIKLLLS